MATAWTNWSGSVRCRAHELATPEGEAGLATIVERAAREGRRIRAVGSGHSFVPLVSTDGIIVSLDRLAGILSHDRETLSASVRAGTKLHDLGEPLLARGLAMENLGDIDVQSLGGALSTGTHGTGRTLGNLASRVAALRLVLASGEILEIDSDHDPETLRAARVSLGALGIVTTARLRLLPAYRLHERTWRAPLAEILEKLDSLILENRHFEFFYFPKADFAEAKAINLTEEEPETVAGRKHERIDWSSRILPSVREERFNEMEYSLPAASGPACLRAAVERVRSRHPDVAWPLEYRTVAADDAWLSPAHGRATVTISVHQHGEEPYREFFADLEPILLEPGGRPHWGKFHTQSAATLAGRYPEWESFQAVQRRLDPGGLFLNEHLATLLGR
ncbi:MAG: D-arabinono-1,4-lactone oxidase [Myxococcota bacterium]